MWEKKRYSPVKISPISMGTISMKRCIEKLLSVQLYQVRQIFKDHSKKLWFLANTKLLYFYACCNFLPISVTQWCSRCVTSSRKKLLNVGNTKSNILCNGKNSSRSSSFQTKRFAGILKLFWERLVDPSWKKNERFLNNFEHGEILKSPTQ